MQNPTGRLAIITLLTAACGGGGDPATTPTAVAASVAISSATTGPFASLTETRAVSAAVRDASGAVIAGAPVAWTTSNPGVASVSGTGATATVTAVGNGSAVITASSGAVQATLGVDVAQKFVALTMTPASPSLGIGATVTLVAVARDARNAAISGATGTTFTTSNRSRALVDAGGVVTAIAPGGATITASLTRDGVTSTTNASVTVTGPAAVSNSAAVSATNTNTFSPSSVTIAVGGTVTYGFSVDHNVLFSGTGAPADIPVTSSGSVARVFNTAGSFAYTCSLHSGMNGTVLVQAPSLLAQMNGTNERPTANSSTANGAALFVRTGSSVSYTVTYQGIASAPTGLHIHAPASAEQASGIIVDLLTTPLPSTSGVLTGTFTATSIRSIGGQPPISLDSLFSLMQSGTAYVNVHSSAFPGGEIRGQTSQP